MNSTTWAACEDLQQSQGAIVLVSSTGESEWFHKTFEPYGTSATDSNYYLGLGKDAVGNASTDILGAKLLQNQALSWADVEAAVPPIRVSGRGGEWGTNCRGVRTFVGSRGAAYDGTIDDLGHVIPGHDWDGCSGGRQIDTIAIGQWNVVNSQPKQTYNINTTAEGIVGDFLPTAFFFLPQTANGTEWRYWSNFIVPVADMQGSREQSVWQRFQQIECSGPQMKPPCKLVPNSVEYYGEHITLPL